MTDLSEDELSHDQNESHMTNHDGVLYNLEARVVGGGEGSHVQDDVGGSHDLSPKSSRPNRVKESRTEALRQLAMKRTPGTRPPRPPRPVKRTPAAVSKPPKKPRLALRSEFLDSADDDDDGLSFVVDSEVADNGSPSEEGPPGREGTGGSSSRGSRVAPGNRREQYFDSESDESDVDDIIGVPESSGGPPIQARVAPGNRRPHFLDSDLDESDVDDVIGVSVSSGRAGASMCASGLGGESRDGELSSDEERLVICEAEDIL